MAATVVSNSAYAQVPALKARVQLSSLVAAQTETIPFAANMASGAAVKRVRIASVDTEPTSGDPVFLGAFSSDESNDQFTVKLDTQNGGDLTGAVVTLEYEQDDYAAQDGTSISTDTDD